MKNLLIYLGGILFFITCNGQNDSIINIKNKNTTMITKEIMELMGQLDQMDERSMMQLLSDIDNQRNDLLAILVKYLGKGDSSNVQAASIYLIGRHRLSNGVTTLYQWIDFEPNGGPRKKSPKPLWDKYPALEALINIGRPSIPLALDLLANEQAKLRRDLALKVMVYVEDAEIAKLILNRAFENENDPIKKSNLEDALMRLPEIIPQ